MKFMCIDESYDSSHTALCGVIFSDDYWPTIERKVNRLKNKHFPGRDPYSFELKSYDIRQGKGVYKDLDADKLNALRGEIGPFIQDLQIKIIATVIDEKRLQEVGWEKEHPYHLAYMFLLERFELMLHSDNDHGIILIDQQANKMGRKKNNTDRKLKDLHHHYRTKGTKYLTFKKLIKSLHVVDSIDSLGVQLADLSVYPILRRFSSDSDYAPYHVVEKKLHRSVYGKIEGYGLKFFP